MSDPTDAKFDLHIQGKEHKGKSRLITSEE